MYIDSLTVAAVIIFLVAVAAFVRACIIRACGLTAGRKTDKNAESMREKRA